MRNSLCILLFGLGVTTAPAMWAQEKDQGGQASRLELYGGYNYVRFNINASASVLQPSSQTFNANGGGGQLAHRIFVRDSNSFCASTSSR